jgi:hypothetical protein
MPAPVAPRALPMFCGAALARESQLFPADGLPISHDIVAKWGVRRHVDTALLEQFGRSKQVSSWLQYR